MLDIQAVKVVSSKGESLAEINNLQIHPATISLLVGKNGSGKTSFLHGAFLHPSVICEARQFTLDESKLTLQDTSELFAQGLHYVPQNLISLPGVSFISFLHTALEHKEKATTSLLTFMQKVKDVCSDYGLPHYLLEKNVHENLSGGEKKLQEIIQLVVLKPRFVFLDEIDAGLDRDSRVLVAGILNRLKKEGMGIFLVSHSFEFTEMLSIDTVHLMKSGKVVQSGGLDIIQSIQTLGFSD